MTLDEAIKMCENDFTFSSEEYEQLAEWLEELKAYQQHWRVTRYEHGEAVSETMSYDIGTIKLIAEQLKEGGENE